MIYRTETHCTEATIHKHPLCLSPKESCCKKKAEMLLAHSSLHVKLSHRPGAADDVERLVDAILQDCDLPLLEEYVLVQGFDLLLQRHDLVLHNVDISPELLGFLPRQVPLLSHCFQCSAKRGKLLCRFLEILLELIDCFILLGYLLSAVQQICNSRSYSLSKLASKIYSIQHGTASLHRTGY